MSTKQSCILLIGACVVVVLAILGVFVYKMMSENKIMKEFDKYYNSEERTIIYYARTGCGYCQLQSPILERLAEVYDLDYLELDSSKLSKKQKEKIISKLGIEDATPMTVVVEKGEVVAKAEGYKSSSAYVDFLIKAGMLEKGSFYSYEDAPHVEVIDYDKYEALIASGEEFVVTVGQTGCSHCTAIKPALDRVVEKQNLKIYYLNLTDLLNSESSYFYQSLTDMEYSSPSYLENGSFGTPTTFTIENGKIKYYIGGERTYSKLVDEFRKQGLID